MTSQGIRVLCVDDNRMLAEAIATQVASQHDLQWAGWLENSPHLAQEIRDAAPDVVLMDIDMPGPDPFLTVSALALENPEIRVLMFSAYVRKDYIDRAVEMGAWGYVSKNESIADVLDALRRASAGEFVLTPDVLAEQRVAQ
jgi:DNA-binding NarL/FixJ family response regulator